MKVGAQIEENCRRGYFLSARVFLPKALVAKLWLIRKLRRIQFAIQEEQLYVECGQDQEHLYIKVTVYLPFSFRKIISKNQDITSTEISYQSLASKVPVLRKINATNSSTSTDAFSAATKTLVLGNLFKLVRFAITFAWAVRYWG